MTPTQLWVGVLLLGVIVLANGSFAIGGFMIGIALGKLSGTPNVLR